MSQRIGLNLNEFVLGYSIIDGRTMAFEQARHEDINDQNEFGQTVHYSFDEKYNRAVEASIRSLNNLLIIQDGEVLIPAGELVAAYIDTQVAKIKVTWDNQIDEITQYDISEYKQPTLYQRLHTDKNKTEMLSDIKDEQFQAVMKVITLSMKLSERREQLREYWGEDTDNRFKWILSHLAARLNNIDQETGNSITNNYIKALNAKLSRNKAESAEYKLIWSLFGLLRIGYNPQFPLLSTTFNRDDSDSFKTVCSAISSHLFWSLVEKKRLDTQVDREEPGLQEVDENSKYERDYNDLEMMARNGSGEPWIKMMYNVYDYIDSDTKEEKQILYRKATDSNETWASVKTATALCNLIQKLFLADKNLKTYRVIRPNHPTNNLNLPALISYYGGKHITIKKVEIEGQEINCKKMSDQKMLTYHYNATRKLFWSAYNEQRKSDIIQDIVIPQGMV